MSTFKKLSLFILSVFISLLIQTKFVHSQEHRFIPYTLELPNVEKGMEMVAISGGEFTMGSPKNEQGHKPDEEPQVRVKLDSFWMGKYEVPWEIYELFIFESGDITKPKDNDSSADAVTRPTPPYLDMTFGMGKEGHPAVGMTQYNAIQFCKWLYTRTGVFYRLPTEAEWEYACRAGTESAYFFGKDDSTLGDYAWYSSNSQGKTHPIGTKKPNNWGLYDMYGNALEWTIDQYVVDFYSSEKGKVAANPVSIGNELYPHAVRGGSFEDNAEDLRSASRRGSEAAWKVMDPQTPKSNWWFPETPFIGVRIVRPFKTPSKSEIDAYYNVKPIADY